MVRSLFSKDSVAETVPLNSTNRAPIAAFGADELLYRRVRGDDVRNNEVLPTAFEWPAPSVLRSSFAEPHHALHANCCDGKQLPAGEWGVAEMKIANLPTPFQSGNSKTFHFFISHKPTALCYSHCELLCRSQEDPADAEKVRPSTALRALYMIELARRSAVRITPAPIAVV